MRLHILVEGPSEAALLNGWLPRFLPRQHTFKVIQHRGKGRLSGRPDKPPEPKHEGLLDQLPAKLRAYGRALNPATERVLVLVDLDEDDCGDLKSRLLGILAFCNPKPVVLFRIAIEETEAFYLGDPAAIRRAFPEAKLSRMKAYTQDTICGTWELFQEIVGAKVEDKPEWAERMSPWLGVAWRGPQANHSPSFCQLCKGLLLLVGEPVD